MTVITSTPRTAGDVAKASDEVLMRNDIIQNAGDANTTGGSVNAYTLSIDSAFTLTNFAVIKFIPHIDNTSASTMNAGSTGVKSLKKKSDSGKVALVAGDLKSGQVYYAIYDGTDWQVIDIPSGVFSVSPLSGEAFSADYALYLKASDGKTYKTVSTAIGEAVENFIGFASAAAAGAGTAIKVKTGPIVSLPTLTLTVGAIYYLTDTAGVISTTPGTIFKPVGFAISATDLYIFPSQGYRRHIVNQSLSVPSIGSTADTTITLPFLPKAITLLGSITICNSAGTGCEYVTFQAHYDKTAISGATVSKSPSGTGNVAPDTIAFQTTSVVATCRSGTDKATLTLSIQSISATSVVLRLTNATTSGSGTTNNQACSVSAIIEA